MAGVVVLDAGVIIGYLNKTDAHHGWVLDLLQRHVDDQLTVSALTHAEYLVGPARVGRIGPALMKIIDFGLDVEDFNELTATQIAVIRAETRLRLPDAAVLHTALERKGSLATTDKALAAVAQKYGVLVHAPF
jgi:predicted nucleic acid-binding protein